MDTSPEVPPNLTLPQLNKAFRSVQHQSDDTQRRMGKVDDRTEQTVRRADELERRVEKLEERAQQTSQEVRSGERKNRIRFWLGMAWRFVAEGIHRFVS